MHRVMQQGLLVGAWASHPFGDFAAPHWMHNDTTCNLGQQAAYSALHRAWPPTATASLLSGC